MSFFSHKNNHIILKPSDLAQNTRLYIINPQRASKNVVSLSQLVKPSQNNNTHTINISNNQVKSRRQEILILSSKIIVKQESKKITQTNQIIKQQELQELQEQDKQGNIPKIDFSQCEQSSQEPIITKKQKTNENKEIVQENNNQPQGIPKIQQISRIFKEQKNSRFGQKRPISQSEMLKRIEENERFVKQNEKRKMEEEQKLAREYFLKQQNKQQENSALQENQNKQTQVEDKQKEKTLPVETLKRQQENIKSTNKNNNLLASTAPQPQSQPLAFQSAHNQIKAQIGIPQQYQIQSTIESRIRKEINLFLTDDVPKKDYYSRQWEEKEDVRHWGQRKLLLCEMWFLTQFGHLSKNIIYAGAAPGQHINYLSLLFKTHEFYLFDPNEFKMITNNRIHLFQQCFTNKDAEEYAQKFQVFSFIFLFNRVITCSFLILERLIIMQ